MCKLLNPLYDSAAAYRLSMMLNVFPYNCTLLHPLQNNPYILIIYHLNNPSSFISEMITDEANNRLMISMMEHQISEQHQECIASPQTFITGLTMSSHPSMNECKNDNTCDEFIILCVGPNQGEKALRQYVAK